MKEKIKGIIIVIIAFLIGSGTTATALLVTRAENITLESDKTDKTNVAEALGELYERTKSYCPEGWACTPPQPKCIRATELNQENCNQTNYGCFLTVGNRKNVTYGNSITTEGVLNTGDAFDCDVDGAGYNHRFYYVSDLYTGGEEGSETFDESTAVLIYYSNIIINGKTIIPNNTTSVAYNSRNYNYEGPLTAMTHIPERSLWRNLNINVNRQIRSEKGTTYTSRSEIYPIAFSGYSNKAARLLTIQELNNGCGLTITTMKTGGSLDTNKCRFLLENTNYANSTYKNGYWLETPYVSNINYVWYVYGLTRYVTTNDALNGTINGVRPAIEVSKSDIAY